MPQPTRPQLALYAAFAIAVLLIGSRFLRSSDSGAGAGAPPAIGALDGSSPDGGSAASDVAGLTGTAEAGGAGGTSGGLDGGEAGSGSPSALDGGDLGAVDAAGGIGASGGAGGTLVVDVKGAVRRPGVYELPPGARALDAVRRAGGVTGKADRLRVNLAARVSDGGEVVVPRKGEAGGALPVGGTGGSVPTGASGSTGGADAGAAGAPLAIDINTAGAQELEQLDGVGPATAAKIIAYREQNGGFASIDELDEVSGIGEAKLAAIRAQLGQ